MVHMEDFLRGQTKPLRAMSCSNTRANTKSGFGSMLAASLRRRRLPNITGVTTTL